jgi:hypothetical protein
MNGKNIYIKQIESNDEFELLLKQDAEKFPLTFIGYPTEQELRDLAKSRGNVLIGPYIVGDRIQSK